MSTWSSPPAAPGFTGRDVTPEAVRPLFEKEIDGFSVLFHMLSYQTVGTSTVQSRACGGLAKSTLIFCVPGSPGACEDAWNGILKFQLDNRHRPCSFIELLPRLTERKKKKIGRAIGPTVHLAPNHSSLCAFSR